MSDDNFQRTIGKLEATLELLNARLTDIDLTLKTISSTTAKLEPKLDSVDERVKKLEAANFWIVTKVLGIVVTALISMVVIKFSGWMPK
ncbi:hypothetical protein [Bosea sp. TAF32]|uniref:hypothetical protein n=1 Tax=Bosea sp. TAF32 TaxID=3237482 RepID=UPI003F90F68A